MGKVASKIKVSLNGTVYLFPAKVVASNRASYYAQQDEDTTFEVEYQLAMEDEDELIDWALNNMDPEDIDPVNVKLEKAGEIPTFEDCWSSHEGMEVEYV